MAPTDRDGDLIGQKLGSYRIEGHLGRGSMASVYRARDVLTRAEVALKVHTRKENEASKRRFFQEARAANLLRHPSIVEVYELGVDGETSFIAMELVRGAPLAQVLQAGALPWQEVVRLTMRIASALGHAHAAGVMHRDLKPSNILLTPEGQVKLVDFGLAKRVGAMPDAGEGATVWDWADVHTQPGAVLGTPAYMSPEQARAAHVDARADVFSLGVVMWEALAGRVLFRRATPASTLRAILTETPPLLEALVPDVPAWLTALVTRALMKLPEARFEDARELLTELKTHADRLEGGLEVALSRIAERHSMILEEPAFVGRARELDLLESALSPITGTAVVVGLPGSGRRRLAQQALGMLGATRPLVVGWSTEEDLKSRFLSRPHDSVILEARGQALDEVLQGARRALGERVRLVLVADRGSSPSARVIRLGPLSPAEGASLLLPFVRGDEGDPEGALRQIARSVGGHAQSLLSLSARAMGEPAGALAAALELEEGWPELLVALGSLRAWIAREVTAMGPSGLELLSGLAATPSVVEEDALALAEHLLGDTKMLALARTTPLIVERVHAELIHVGRVAVPALVRRVLFELGDAGARKAAQSFLLARLAGRLGRLAQQARERPPLETVRELHAERETVLSLVTHVLAQPAGEDLPHAAEALVALAEADALREPAEGPGALGARPLDRASDAMIEGDHLLGRVLARGGLPAPLTLRVLLARSARRLLDLSSVSSAHTAGIDDAIALARSLEDAGAEAALLVARAGREEHAWFAKAAETGDLRPLHDATRADIEAALSCLPPSAPAWRRQEVLEHAGELRWALGEPDAARGALRNALVLAEEREDARGQARLAHRLTRLDVCLGTASATEASDLLTSYSAELAALELAVSAGDAMLAGLIEASLAELSILRGELGAARTHAERAASHGPLALARAALVAGHVELIEGRLERARALYLSSLLGAEQQRDAPAVTVAQAALAAVLAASFDRPGASDALVRATLAARTQPPAMRLVVAGWRGHLERALLDRDRAVASSGDHRVSRPAVSDWGSTHHVPDDPDQPVEPRLLEAQARFAAAGLVAFGASEAGTGPRIGARVLFAAAR
jgi:tetratricopeptide (TPR) repeat protein